MSHHLTMYWISKEGDSGSTSVKVDAINLHTAKQKAKRYFVTQFEPFGYKLTDIS